MVTRKEVLAKVTAAGEPFEIIETTARGRAVKVFKNAPATLRNIYEATRSDKTFLVYNDERLTFEQTFRKAATLADVLVNEFGVQKGDRIAISMRNFPEWIIAFMAATSVGGIAVAMNALWQPQEMAFALKQCGSTVLFADQERLDRLTAAGGAPEGVKVVAVRTTAPLAAGYIAWSDLLDRPEKTEMPGVALDADDDTLMLFTSGSTGHPKGAVSSHRSVVHALVSWELDATVGVVRGLITAPDPEGPQTGALLGIPLFHVTGLHAVSLACFRYQRRLVTMYKWNAEEAAQLVEREGLTHFTAPSAVTGDLVEVARKGGHDLSTLTYCGGGGAARAPEQVKAISQVFGNAKPATGWGMTETNAIGTGFGSQDYLDHPDSSGQVSAVLDIRIVDPATGAVLPTGERGELQIRGVSMMQGYYNNDKANAEAHVDGDWFKTGDVAYIDDEGFVYIVDRIKDLVIRGGENIGCGAVEGALTEHPDILEACVYGVPDQRLGEEVGATVYATAPIDKAQLDAFLAERIAKFMIPRYLRVETVALPRGATGKIAKKELRAEAVDQLKVDA